MLVASVPWKLAQTEALSGNTCNMNISATVILAAASYKAFLISSPVSEAVEDNIQQKAKAAILEITEELNSLASD